MLDTWINDNSRPLIFIGSSSAMFFLTDLCEQHNIKIAGIIDSDYFGNTAEIEGIPVIDTELSFDDPARLEYYRSNFNFFLASNWVPDTTPVETRNRQKRTQLMTIIESLDLPCISLVDTSARVHKTTRIGKNVTIDALCYIAAKNVIGDFTNIFASTVFGYNNVLGKNVVFQRMSGTMNHNQIGNNVYVGLHTQICAENLTVADGTVLHPCLALRRSTKENELISLAGKDLRRVYNYLTIEE